MKWYGRRLQTGKTSNHPNACTELEYVTRLGNKILWNKVFTASSENYYYPLFLFARNGFDTTPPSFETGTYRNRKDDGNDGSDNINPDTI